MSLSKHHYRKYKKKTEKQEYDFPIAIGKVRMGNKKGWINMNQAPLVPQMEWKEICSESIPLVDAGETLQW